MKRATHSLSCLWGLISISIHALVKRATDGKLLPKQIKGDFNPRPREEGDRQFPGLTRSYRYFNPRPREEGDLFIDYIVPNLCISIHALVKRATTKSLGALPQKWISIHALVKRATSSLTILYQTFVFQSTPS